MTNLNHSRKKQLIEGKWQVAIQIRKRKMRARLCGSCSRRHLSSENIYGTNWYPAKFHASFTSLWEQQEMQCHLLVGLYRTTVTYLDWNLCVRPRATIEWEGDPFSIKRWLRVTCWGLSEDSSVSCIPSTVRCNCDGTTGGSLAKSSCLGNDQL